MGATGHLNQFARDADGIALKVDVVAGNVTLEASDINIGAVTIKDGDSAQLLTINPDGSVDVHDLNAVAASGSILPALYKVVAGSDGLNVRPIRTDSSGIIQTDVLNFPSSTTVNNGTGASAVNVQDGGNVLSVDDAGGSLTIDGTVTVIPSGTQNVNVTGNTTDYATQTTLALIKTQTDNLDVALSTRLKAADTLNKVTTVDTITNVVHVDDNGGSITVDGTVSAIQSGAWTTGRTWTLSFSTDKVDVTGSTVAIDASSLAALESITVQNASGASAVNIQDGGNSITVDGTVSVSNQNAQFAEDSVAANADLGTMALGVRNDAAATKTTTDGDYTAFATDAAGRIGIADLGGSITIDGTIAATQSGPWTVTANAGSGTFVTADNQTLTDNGTFTDGSSKVFLGGFVLDETPGIALTENDTAAARIDSKRAQVLVIEDATTRGQRATVTAANAVKVDGSAVTQPVSGTVAATQSGVWTVATNSERAEDSAHSSGQTGNFVLAVRNDAGTSLVDTTLDYAPLQVDATGALRTAGTSTVSFTAEFAEDSPATNADTGVQVLGVRNDTAATKTTTDGDYTAFATDAAGRIGIADLGGSITVDAVSFPLPTGAATEATLALVKAKTDNLDVALSTRLKPADTLTAVTTVGTITNVVHIDDNAGSITVDGTVSAIQSGAWSVSGSGTFTVADNQTIADNATFTDGTSKVFMGGFILDEVAGTALTENDAAAARIDSKRAQVFVIEDATTRGQRATVTAANAVKVDGSAVTQPVSGTVTITPSGTQDENLKQVNGVTVNVGIGTAGTGTQRVAVSSDSFPATQVVSGPLTDAQLRASAVPTSLASEHMSDVATSPSDMGVLIVATRNDAPPVDFTTANFHTSGIAVDAKGRVGITDLGGSITVDGTVGVSTTTGTLANGAETAVSSSAVQILATNASRKIAVIQNTGVANIRVGVTGVTTTTGLRLIPGAIQIFEMPYITTQALFAIREGLVDSIAFAQETT